MKFLYIAFTIFMLSLVKSQTTDASNNPFYCDEACINAAPGQNSSSLTSPSDPPDVFLDIPNISAQELSLSVDNLKVDIALDARVANFVHISGGITVSISNVNLKLTGAQASAQLSVRLDNVRGIISDTFDFLNNNTEIIKVLKI